MGVELARELDLMIARRHRCADAEEALVEIRGVDVRAERTAARSPAVAERVRALRHRLAIDIEAQRHRAVAGGARSRGGERAARRGLAYRGLRVDPAGCG